MEPPTPYETNITGDVLGFVQGEHNTVTLVFNGRKRVVPFLAPTKTTPKLIGRDAVLNEIKRRLFAGDTHHPIVLQGLPGVGKTALSIALAYDRQVLSRFPDGILWASIGRRSDVLSNLGRWGTALGLSARKITKQSTVEDRALAVHDAIGIQRMLLIVDNIWREEDALAFQIGGPGCAYLFTTRLPGVARQISKEFIPIKELGDPDALDLLKSLAPSAVEINPGVIQTIVEMVDGLPLALVLIGKHLSSKDWQDQPWRLRAELDRLREKQNLMNLDRPVSPLERSPDLPSGKVSLQAVIAVSDEALADGDSDDRARRSFWALSMFVPKPNTFSREAVLSVTEATDEIFSLLVDRGILESSGQDRFTFHQVLDEYATGKLIDKQDAQEKMLAFYTRFVEDNKQNYVELDIERDNILEAVRIAELLDKNENFMQILNGLTTGGYFEARGYNDEWLNAIKLAIEITKGQHQDLLTQHHLWSKLGNLYADVADDVDSALEAYQQALTLAEALGLPNRIARLRTVIGTIRARQNEPDADSYYTQAEQIATQHNDLRELSVVFEHRGHRARYHEAYSQAHMFFSTSLKFAEELDAPDRLYYALLNLGSTERKLGNYAVALTLDERALKTVEDSGNEILLGRACQSCGESHHALGDKAKALQYYDRALQLFQASGAKSDMKNVLDLMQDDFYRAQSNYLNQKDGT